MIGEKISRQLLRHERNGKARPLGLSEAEGLRYCRGRRGCHEGFVSVNRDVRIRLADHIASQGESWKICRDADVSFADDAHPFAGVQHQQSTG